MRYLCCGLALVASCKPQHKNPDAPGPPWWSPKVGDVKNWDIQLAAPIDVSADRVMYDLDLWSLVPAATMIDYGDGDPVAVPAGSLAGTIEQLHARRPKTIVICHVGVGSVSLSDPDARKFPGYETNPPDSPIAPKPDSVIGWTVGSDPKIRFVDIRATSRAKVDRVLWKRFDLASQLGCDGVEGYDIERSVASSGWTVTGDDFYAMYGSTAGQAHDRTMSAGMKNGDSISDAIDRGAGMFDWIMIERCGENMDCDLTQPFSTRDKAALAIDYDHKLDGTPQSSSSVCGQQVQRIADGIYKDDPPTNNVRVGCNP